MKLTAESFKEVNYGEYREYGRVFDRLIESISEDDLPNMSTDEQLEIMLYAAIVCGWVDGMERDVTPEGYIADMQVFRDELVKMHPGNVLSSLREFSIFYNRLRSPDPN